MDVLATVHAAPPTLPGGLERADDLVAVHREDGVALQPPSAAESAPGTVGPVYRRSGGSLAVPTGRAFVRFTDGEAAQAHAGSLGAAGWTIEEVPGYAPHAAWVRPARGGVVAALTELEGLRALPGVEHAEAQLLDERAPRG